MKMSRITGPRLAGPLSPLDPRDNAWRADLADLALADRVAVASYVVPAVSYTHLDVYKRQSEG